MSISLISLISLILANLIPLVGVFAFGWSASTILAVYWLENGLIGAFTLLRIATVAPSDDARAGRSRGARFALLPFFVVHYGLFWFVHGVFLSTILGLERSAADSGPAGLIAALMNVATMSGSQWAIFSLVLSHAVSFVGNYLIGGERTRTTAPRLMFAPYGRVVVMHLTILLGGWAVLALGEPVALVVLLVILKTVIDAISHRREHATLTPGGVDSTAA